MGFAGIIAVRFAGHRQQVFRAPREGVDEGAGRPDFVSSHFFQPFAAKAGFFPEKRFRNEFPGPERVGFFSRRNAAAIFRPPRLLHR